MRPVSKHFGSGWNGAVLTQKREARPITGSPKAQSAVVRSRFQLEAITLVVISSLLLLGVGLVSIPGRMRDLPRARAERPRADAPHADPILTPIVPTPFVPTPLPIPTPIVPTPQSPRRSRSPCRLRL